MISTMYFLGKKGSSTFSQEQLSKKQPGPSKKLLIHVSSSHALYMEATGNRKEISLHT